MFEQSPVQSLASSLRGELIQRHHPAYAEARKVYNAMIDRHPGMIARCADGADVMTAVRFAHEHEIVVSIRGGGHNAAGLGVCNDGLVIDLSPMRGVHVDPRQRTVRVGGGATWGDVDHATHAFGMATPSGIISTTGVGGLTLGGGLGHLTRKCGLTIDNLLAADMVLADGSFVTASAEDNPDLFWAIRGGGGNFGVVTSFLFRTHPVDTVYAGPTLWSLDRAAEVLEWYREFLPHAPDAVNGFFAFLKVPPAAPFPENLHGKPMCGIVWCCAAPVDEAEKLLAPVQRMKPAFSHVGPLPFPALQTFFDPLYPPGLHWYWKADFFTEIKDPAIAEHVRYGSALPTELSTMHLYPVDGAAHRVAPDATPWSYRDATWSGVIVGVSPDPGNREQITQWARDYWNALHPHSSGGAYVNFMMEEGEDRVQATYRDNYARLVKIKRRYDPDNFFRVNQNIKP